MTVAEWLAVREPRPPAALSMRMEAVLGDGLAQPADRVATLCIAAGERLLSELLHNKLTTRESALDLLTADALVTYAFDPGAGGHPCGKGARYILNQWHDLIKFIDHSELRLDNNLAEGDLRMVALIRKNSLYLGAASAGPRFAACLSILRSCRLARINPNDYLTDITPTLIRWRQRQRAKLPTPDLDHLTPKRWAVANADRIRRAV